MAFNKIKYIKEFAKSLDEMNVVDFGRAILRKASEK